MDLSLALGSPVQAGPVAPPVARHRARQLVQAAGRLVRALNARLWLRGCTLGPGVRLKGRPHVTARGTIRLGAGVCVHAFLQRVQLSAGPGAVLEVGAGTFINNGAVLSARQRVSIGARCQIAPGVVLMDNDFHAPGDLQSAGKCAPIVIEDDVWLATRAVVLRGVRVGQGAVVAAGAVVTRDVPPYTLVAGVPARVIRSLRPEAAAPPQP